VNAHADLRIKRQKFKALMDEKNVLDSAQDDVDVNGLAQRVREFEVIPENLSVELLVQVLEIFSMLFCDTLGVEEQSKRNLIIFGSHDEVETRFRLYAAKLHSLRAVMEEKFRDLGDEKKNEMECTFDKVSSSLFSGREVMVYLYSQIFVNNPELSRTLPLPRMEEFYHKITEESMKGHHKLIRFYLLICHRRKYKKMKGSDWLFEPTYTLDGHFTHYYRPACSISDFIYDAIYPYLNHATQFMQLTDRGSTPSAIINFLTHCKDDSLPFLVRSRCVFSYQNGVYDAETDRFYVYAPQEDWPYKSVDLPLDVVACNYLDYVFDFLRYEQELTEDNDPLDIQTDNCQIILSAQEFEREVCRWSYASIGRLIFPVGMLDNWQYFLFYKGTAGSGKSTTLSLASQFFSPSDVGLLMTEGQHNFSIEHLYDKYVFFCMDADEKMTLSQTRWNQMVSGEMVSIERKFKIPLSLKWDTTGAFAGNGYPPWIDRGGNVSRRFLVFLHEQVVTKADPLLMDKCKRELPAFMKKCVACYHDVRKKHGHQGIWDEGVLPVYFQTTKRDLQGATNALQSFLQSEDQCVLDSTKSCDFSLFRNQFHIFCAKRHIAPLKLTGDSAAPVWKSNNIRRVIPDSTSPVPILVGVDLVQ
jgi:hypothetical protein